MATHSAAGPTPAGEVARSQTSVLGPTRRRLLATLQAASHPLPIEALSDEMDLHPNTLRFHLIALMDAGLVTADTERRTTQGRPRRLYSATASSPTVDADHYRELAGAFIRHLSQSATGPAAAETLGTDWGRLLADQNDPMSDSLDELSGVVQRLGFTSRVVSAGDQPVIEITRCPYHDLAKADETVCRIHQGMIEGYLQGVGSPLSIVELTPWATETTCRARFGPRSAQA